jgi:hypothetical protein
MDNFADGELEPKWKHQFVVVDEVAFDVLWDDGSRSLLQVELTTRRECPVARYKRLKLGLAYCRGQTGQEIEHHPRIGVSLKYSRKLLMDILRVFKGGLF